MTESPAKQIGFQVTPIFPTNILQIEFSQEDIQSLIPNLVSLLEQEKELTGLNVNNESMPLFVVEQTDKFLHKREETEFKQLVDYIHAGAEIYKNVSQLECEKLEISLCWANKTKKGAMHHMHTHPLSYLSGIIYLTDGSDTIFFDPIHQRYEGQFRLEEPGFPNEAYYPATPGIMLLFPSWLKHSTRLHDLNTPRWTISFNLLPSGKCGHGLSFWDISVN